LREQALRFNHLLAGKRGFGLDIYLSCLLGGLIALATFVLCGAGFPHPGGHRGKASLGHNGLVSSHQHSFNRPNAASDGDWPCLSILRLLGWFSPPYLCGSIISFGGTGTMADSIASVVRTFVAAQIIGRNGLFETSEETSSKHDGLGVTSNIGGERIFHC
jgi:hypothetical protein